MPEIIEKLESRSIQTSGGRGTGKRVFFASGYANPKLVLDTFGTEVGSIKVPDKGTAYPDLPGLVAKDFTISPVAGHQDLYKIDWAYEMVSSEWLSAPDNRPPDRYPSEIGYVELSSDIRTEFYLAWRKDPRPPTNGDPEPDDDIGGEAIDAGGNPTSIMRRKQELVLTETVNRVDYGQISGYAFHRNSAPFLGADVGRVLYRGASIRRTGLNVYTIAHSFIDDQYSHCEQQPLIDQNGIAIDEDKDGKADEVYFVQPFTDKKDLNQLSNQFGT